MSKHPAPIRPGLTAIAAVLAFTATPLLAQDAAVAPAAEPAAPVAIAPPPAPAVGSAPATAPAVPMVATPAPAAPATTSGLNVPNIRVDLTPIEPAAVAEAEPAPAAAAPAPAHQARASLPAPERRGGPEPAFTRAAPAPAPAEPVAAAPVAPVASTATPAPVAPLPVEPAPVVTTEPAPQSVAANDDILPIAGAAGLAVIALAGGAVALGRRRRRPEEAYVADTYDAGDRLVVAVPQQRASENAGEPMLDLVAPVAPAVAAAPMMTPAAPAVARNEAPVREPVRPLASTAVPHATAGLPAGFDLSRFGRHVQAAYQGPTADNPSLSLKTRLKRARFFDQRERMAAEGSAIPQRTAEAPAPRPAPVMQQQRQTDHVVTRIKRPATTSFRPAFQG